MRTPPHLVNRAIGPIPSDLFLELFARVPARVVDPVVARLNRLLLGDLSPYGFQRPPLGMKATVEQRGRIPTLADELIDAVRAGRIEVVTAVTAVDAGRVMLADGSTVTPDVIIAATGFSTDLDGLVGHLGILDEHGDPRGGFSSHLGDGMFAIGYGIPPNGPLRAIRLAATPLADGVAAYLNTRKDCDDRTPRTADVFRGSDGYEAARRDTVWNAIVPQRNPDVIVQARAAETSSQRSVRRAHGHRVGSVPARTAGRQAICATVACYSTSAVSSTAVSTATR